jgi:hypothetical protein
LVYKKNSYDYVKFDAENLKAIEETLTRYLEPV